MNTKVILTGVLAIAAAAVAPVVSGRYGDALAVLLRVEVLAGLAVVTTLVALITLEYGRGATRTARQPVALRSLGDTGNSAEVATIVALPKDGDTRAAA